jgi:hypothetical protein
MLRDAIRIYALEHQSGKNDVKPKAIKIERVGACRSVCLQAISKVCLLANCSEAGCIQVILNMRLEATPVCLQVLLRVSKCS